MTAAYRLSWREMQEFRRDQLKAIARLVDELGPVARIKILNMQIILVCDPELIRELLIKHPQHLHRDPFTSRVLGRIIGDGLFIAEDESWARKRKLMQPIFHASHIQEFATAFAEETRALCAGWKKGEERQLDQEMMGLALRIICGTMFGADISDRVARIGMLMQAIMTEAEAHLRSGLPIPQWLPTPGNRRMNRALAEIRTMLLEIIRTRRAELAADEAAGEDERRDLLTMLLLARDDEDRPLSEEDVLDECLTIFVAGHETTAVALTWTWLLLLRHPEILTKVRREADAVGVPVDLSQAPPYLTQVIKESLRLYPPAAAFGRTPTEPFEAAGHTFQPDDTIIISTYVMQHLETLYPDPERFNPDRFRAEVEPPPRYAYLPFGAGSRTCIGNAFAMLEMQVALTTMLQMVDLSLTPGQSFEPETVVTLRTRNGVRVRVDGVRV